MWYNIIMISRPEVIDLFDRVFIFDALERAFKTFVQVLLTFFIGGVTILNASWDEALVVSATAALVSVLTSIVSAKASDGTASLVQEVHYGKEAAE